MQEGPPLRTLRLSNQRHVRFLRQPVALAGITWNARANDIFPRRGAATIAWNHVIEIQIGAIEEVAAILTGVLVPLENVVPRKLHFLFRQAIKKEKNDHARNPNSPGNRANEFMVWRARRKLTPAREVVRQKVVGVVRGNDMRVAGVNQ